MIHTRIHTRGKRRQVTTVVELAHDEGRSMSPSMKSTSTRCLARQELAAPVRAGEPFRDPHPAAGAIVAGALPGAPGGPVSRRPPGLGVAPRQGNGSAPDGRDP